MFGKKKKSNQEKSVMLRQVPIYTAFWLLASNRPPRESFSWISFLIFLYANISKYEYMLSIVFTAVSGFLVM